MNPGEQAEQEKAKREEEGIGVESRVRQLGDVVRQVASGKKRGPQR